MGASLREPYSQPEDDMARFLAEIDFNRTGIINRLNEITNHDCKLSQDSSCKTCEEIFNLKESLRELDSLVAQVNNKKKENEKAQLITEGD